MTPPVRLTLTAQSSAGLLCRLIGLLAQHDLAAPDLKVTTRGTEMRVEMVLRGLSPQSARIAAEKMRGCIGVVSVSETGSVPAPA
ncbi:hypothetical protein [Croceicoccus marinus]|jgi:hypothetical protein|uniref:ACT domain-containing protein n=1 Tax=Croceicoccus marinus TaxID=450378 RepID=A0A1Z1FGW5_9SPHN|nr:hypothetical protein [Croceicoccus marinus]ARU17992.1 hypothetical protein A9D14_16910 [Croceicoccus marinus]QNE07497.1 hypothetical protein H4O24_16635 [Croceicoccus marinus]